VAFRLLFNSYIPSIVDHISQLLPLIILDTLLSPVVSQVLGAEQTQSESVGFVPVNLQLIACRRTFGSSGVWN